MRRFFSDGYGANVTKMIPDSPSSYGAFMGIGMWRYGQGHWISCDASVVNRAPNIAAAKALCLHRDPEIRHSVNLFGSYMWIDLTHGFYGVYMQGDWKQQAMSDLKFWSLLCLGIAALVGILVWLICYRFCRGKNSYSSGNHFQKGHSGSRSSKSLSNLDRAWSLPVPVGAFLVIWAIAGFVVVAWALVVVVYTDDPGMYVSGDLWLSSSPAGSFTHFASHRDISRGRRLCQCCWAGPVCKCGDIDSLQTVLAHCWVDSGSVDVTQGNHPSRFLWGL